MNSIFATFAENEIESKWVGKRIGGREKERKIAAHECYWRKLCYGGNGNKRRVKWMVLYCTCCHPMYMRLSQLCKWMHRVHPISRKWENCDFFEKSRKIFWLKCTSESDQRNNLQYDKVQHSILSEISPNCRFNIVWSLKMSILKLTLTRSLRVVVTRFGHPIYSNM